MGSFSIWHWLIVLLIVGMVFGTKKLGNVGKDLGSAVKGFKEGMAKASAENPVVSEPHLRYSVEAEAKEPTR